MCLMSPKKTPNLSEDGNDNDEESVSKKIGNLFTLFLSDPLGAFCFVTNKRNISTELYDKATKKKDEALAAMLQVIQSQPDMDPAFSLFLQEEFLRRFILNYVFCMATLMYHKKFQHKVCKVAFFFFFAKVVFLIFNNVVILAKNTS